VSNDYLIETSPDEHHRLMLSWSGDRSLIYISTNSRTMGCSPAMAAEICRGLTALLHGPFDRALSETALRLELEDAAFRASRRTTEPSRSESPQTRPPQPELDSL